MGFCLTENKKGMTMVEMLVVIIIISILFASFFYIWNTMDIFRKSRDSKRINDLQIIDTALKTILTTEKNINLGQENVIYTSLPDSSSTCGSYNLIPVYAPYSYRCQTSDNYLKIDGNGWLPVNFTLGKILTISVLPIDPLNNKDYFYAYQVRGGRYKLSARFESKANINKMANDGGFELTLYEVGSDLFIPSPQSGLVGYWNFDETGTIARDLSGYNNNGTMYSSTIITDLHTTTSCKIGLCANFDGVDDYVYVGNSYILQITSDLTILMWLYPTNITKGRQNPLGKAYGGEYMFTLETNGNLSFFQGSCGGNCSPYGYNSNAPYGMTNNNWYFVGIRRINARQRMDHFKNGSKINDGSYSWVNPSVSSNAVRIGREYAGYFQGLIDEVRIYNRALSDQEIKVLYEVTK
ncbi:MAG: hypothetical protein KatS3mg096_206 [Candidatus Parcubacteria bacterium]|nr:MAG: hypothetical protein KatS3mg096_206 [Candidatus Parcubacteria bacterium]